MKLLSSIRRALRDNDRDVTVINLMIMGLVFLSMVCFAAWIYVW